MTGRDTNSHGWSRGDDGGVELAVNNRTPISVTGDTIVLDGDLTGTGIDNLLAALGSSDAADTSFTVNSGTLRLHWHRLAITGSQRATLSGTGRLQVSDAVSLSPTGLPTLTSSYAPGSFTVSSGQFRIVGNHLRLGGTQRTVLQGSGRLFLL